MSFVLLIELLGTFAFAVSGAFAAMEKKLDWFGVMIIAFVTAIGGGTVRDVLIGSFPVAWLMDTRSISVIIAAALLAVFFSSFLRRFDKVLLIVDAIGLALFSIAGMQKALMFGLAPGICVALGTITGCFGGVLRDVLLNNVPLIFQKEIYASACIVGGIVYFMLLQFRPTEGLAEWISIGAIILVRLLAVRFGWSLPRVNG
jgi:uncharacterized membrane protein YeiH